MALIRRNQLAEKKKRILTRYERYKSSKILRKRKKIFLTVGIIIEAVVILIFCVICVKFLLMF